MTEALKIEIADLEAELDEFYRQMQMRCGSLKELASRPLTAVDISEGLAYRGDDENRLYRGFVGGTEPIALVPSALPFTSTLCQQVHFSLDQYRFWAKAMKESPKYLRKQWEFIYIAQVLYERSMLKGGMKGLAFGVGREPLPALFASFGCDIVATDQSLAGAVDAGWVRSAEHSTDLSGLNDRGICTERMFTELVSFAELDMNFIPASFSDKFDFCWSACALEHLGSLEHGLKFVRRSLDTLKPGGVAVHTTEFNLSSNDATINDPTLCLFRQCDIEQLIREVESDGFIVDPIDWTVGRGFAETVVDLPPYGRGEPHIRLRLGEFDCTSIGLIIAKPA